jgi:hypothetical protein
VEPVCEKGGNMKRVNRILLAAGGFAGLVVGGQMVGFGASMAGAAPVQAETVVITTDVVSGAATFTASGAASGTGTSTDLSSTTTGSVSHGVTQLAFTDGSLSGSTFTVKHVDHSTETFDPVACTITFTARGNFVDTSGTGALSNVKGAGHYTQTGTATLPTTGGCDPNAAPVSGTIVTTATGHIKL